MSLESLPLIWLITIFISAAIAIWIAGIKFSPLTYSLPVLDLVKPWEVFQSVRLGMCQPLGANPLESLTAYRFIMF